jgi:hypothetical protein
LCGSDWSFSLVGLGVGDFIVGRAALKAALTKMVKHKKACSDVVNLLKRDQYVMHSNVVSPKSMNIIFQKLKFAIQKRVCGTTCCPSTFY